MADQTTLIPNQLANAVSQPMASQELIATGAITIPAGVVVLNKSGVIVATLAAPVADGLVMHIVSETAQAHTVTLASTGTNASSTQIMTWGGAVGDGITLVSIGSEWYTLAATNVTFS